MLPSRFILAAVGTAVALVLGVTAPAAGATAAPRVAAATEATPPQATTFTTPLKKAYSISSYYGARCMPVAGASTFHLGVDLAAPTGTPIYAVAAGVVVATVDGTSSQAGYIKIRHRVGAVTYTSFYYHIWDSTTHVTVGEVVKAGQRISEVGSSGRVSGPHLHLEIWKGEPGSATSLDPAPFMKKHGVDLYGAATAIFATRAPATCTYYTTTLVNFRTGPSTSSPVIRALPAATKVVHVPGAATGGYLPVTVGSTKGWISSSYLSPDKPVVATPAPAQATTGTTTPAKTAKPATSYKTTAALNLRATASLNGKVLLVLPRGAAVGTVKGTSGTWRKITYKKKTGWVSSAYLTAASSATTSSSVTKTTPKKATTYQTTAALNLRKSASLTGARILVIPRGANVGTVKASNGVWRKITYKKHTGWVSSAYLKKG
ncbi:SH3 domain-containing protein [Microbacterium sp. KR10-403]|uniref:SH3 domain-containing protein n=1 Tax=Microbacterium sp. KR10-403 TaxID=3158581 RepID=UPI0032E3D04F